MLRTRALHATSLEAEPLETAPETRAGSKPPETRHPPKAPAETDPSPRPTLAHGGPGGPSSAHAVPFCGPYGLRPTAAGRSEKPLGPSRRIADIHVPHRPSPHGRPPLVPPAPAREHGAPGRRRHVRLVDRPGLQGRGAKVADEHGDDGAGHPLAAVQRLAVIAADAKLLQPSPPAAQPRRDRYDHHHGE